MNLKHTEAAQVIGQLSSKKEFEIQRELLLQHNELDSLESMAGQLLERLGSVLRQPEDLRTVIGEDGNIPKTAMGNELRTNSNRIGAMTSLIDDILHRLEV